MLISTGHLGSFGFHLFSSSSLAFFCDLSLVVALTLDFVIATHSPKQTLHAGCLCVFPVCSISASWTLKAWSPSLGNSAQKKLFTSLCQGLKWRLLDPTQSRFFYTCLCTWANGDNTAGLQSTLLKAPRSPTPSHSAVVPLGCVAVLLSICYLLLLSCTRTRPKPGLCKDT